MVVAVYLFVLALMVGGFWGGWRFWRRREHDNRASSLYGAAAGVFLGMIGLAGLEALTEMPSAVLVSTVLAGLGVFAVLLLWGAWQELRDSREAYRRNLALAEPGTYVARYRLPNWCVWTAWLAGLLVAFIGVTFGLIAVTTWRYGAVPTAEADQPIQTMVNVMLAGFGCLFLLIVAEMWVFRPWRIRRDTRRQTHSSD